MEIFWYIIILCLLLGYFILDGYDFGTGIIHLFFAKKEEDKKVIAKAAGLFWDSNEVWLVAVGGLLFMAFPTYYASVFSGFYLPLIIVLWLMIFRALGLELRGQIDNHLWKQVWDVSFGVSSLLLALFFGIALGNIIRGVNLGEVQNNIAVHEAHFFFLPLWDESVSPISHTPGVIDYFTIIIGIIAVVTLAIHGANWVILKTRASINPRLKKVTLILNVVLLILTAASLLIWNNINSDAFKNFIERPYLLVFPLIYMVGMLGIFLRNKFKRDNTPFVFSSMLIVGGITTTFASIFPSILPSTNNVNASLTIYNTAASDYAQSTAVYWGILAIILIIIYTIVQKRLNAGKVDDMTYEH